MELLLLLAAAILVLWLLASREKHAARLTRLEKSVEHLYEAGSSVAQRVAALESRPSLTPSSAYRAAAPVDAPRPPFDERPSFTQPTARILQPAFAAAAPSPSLSPSPSPSRTPAPAPAPSPSPALSLALPSDPVPEKPAIEWERWIGVRGAAALGAGILVVALFFFLRHSIAVGWLTLELRVALGALVGATCVAAAQLRLRASHPVLSSWLTGAGIAGLYASIWAAATVASLIGSAAAFALVVGVTIGCVALAVRDGSLPIALLGAAGGFAAPLMLSFNASRPYATIAYVLVLDVAMVVLAAKKRWWSLSALAMLLSAAYDAVWLSMQGASSMPLQVGLLTVFSGVFGAVPAIALGDTAPSDEPPSPLATVTRYGSVLVPMAFAAWLTQDPTIVTNPAPIGVLCVLLTMMATAIAYKQREAPLPFLAALGAPAVLVAWMAQAEVAAHASSLGALLVVIALPHLALVAAEHRKLRGAAGEGAKSEVLDIAAAGSVLYLLVAISLVIASSIIHPGPWAVYLGTALVLAAVAIGLARAGKMPAVASLPAIGTVLGAVAIALSHRTVEDGGPTFFSLFGCLAVTAALTVLGRRAEGDERRELLAGARRGAFAAILALAVLSSGAAIGVHVCLAIALGSVALAARDGRDQAYPTTFALIAIAMGAMTWLSSPEEHVAAGVASLGVGVFFLVAPLVRPLGLADSVWAPRGQVFGMTTFALTVGTSFFSWQAELVGAGVAALAATALVLYVALRRVTTSEAVRHEAEVWLGNTTIALTSAGIALGFRNEHLTWAWAALGTVLAYLATRKRSDALAIIGVVHLVVAGVRVFANPAVLTYHARGDLPILNWVTPTFLVPALAAGIAWWLLGRMREVTGEKYGLRVVPATVGLLAVFTWANVAVLDVFSSGTTISFHSASAQARDLSISLVWALFGTGLLVLGMRRAASALRWTSLVLILGTAGKVFLLDLSQLEDLYRVASLAGLAISLLGISLLYQRFVFRAPGQQA